MNRYETNRWRGIGAATFLAAAVGILSKDPAAFIVGVVGAAYAGYARFDADPDPSLVADRTIDAETPQVGDDVEVTVTVRNEGGFVPDLRIVDNVPGGLSVVDGSPRLATSLRSGKTATFTYTVEAERGEHTFEDVTVVARNAPGTVAVEDTVEAKSKMRCVPSLEHLASFPLHPQAARRVGRLSVDEGGSGVEFHATREYRRSDPLARVDWNRLARTGDLATVEFREERAGTVVIIVDTRAEAYVAGPDADSAVEYGVHAAGAAAGALLDAGDRVGLASYGPRASWLPVGLGRDHRQRFRERLATDPAFAPTAPEKSAPFSAKSAFTRFRKRLPTDAQVVCCTPLTDDVIARFLRRIDAHGHRVTVISPDATSAESAGNRLSRVERRVRVRDLRSAGIRVVEWGSEQPLAVALAEAQRGWGQ